MTRIAIVGAGAAGCFCAANLARFLPEAEVVVFEASDRPMAKLALTGGGRCNLTNTFEDCGDLSGIYPRGHRLMSRLLHGFGSADTRRWFEAEGVRLKTEEQGRVFPVSDDALEVVECLGRAMRRGGVKSVCRRRIDSLSELAGFDAVVVTVGGGAARLLDGRLRIEKPVPSLFGFNLDGSPFGDLAGLSLAGASLLLNCGGRRFRSDGEVLITHRGLSGPAVLRLSSYAARALDECGYKAALGINYLSLGEEETLALLEDVAGANPSKMLVSVPLRGIPSRLWKLLVTRAGIRPDCRCAELGGRGMRRLASTLTNDSCIVSGRTSGKGEFVTCGGVALSEVDPLSLEAKKYPSLYLAGEVLDIDAVTGGFNLQAAWTTAMTVARSLAARFESAVPEP